MCIVRSSEYKFISFRKKNKSVMTMTNALLLFTVLQVTNNPMPSLFQIMKKSNISQKKLNR